MARITSVATSAAQAPKTRTVRKPFCEGSATPPKEVVMLASSTPTTALDVEVPMERMRVFRPFAAAVSVGGTAAMMRAGIAA